MNNNNISGCVVTIALIVLACLSSFLGYETGRRVSNDYWKERLLKEGAYVQMIENNKIVLTLKEKKDE